nr:cytoplasmic protein [Cryptococcus depauperatus CBS 7841]
MSPVIIVTGASRGLGLAVLHTLLDKYHARVATLSRSLSPALQETAKQYGDRILVVQGDVSKPEDNARVVEEVMNRWGQVDGLVVNAGNIDPVGKVSNLPLDALVPYIQTNLFATIYLVQPALPHLRKSKGRIVLVSSGASSTGYQAWGLYSMTKAGLNSLARTIGNEEKDNGVAIWAVRPGVVDEQMQAFLRTHGQSEMSEAELAKFKGAFERGELLPPAKPGAVLAGLAVEGPLELSGEYLNWTDERLQKYQL